MARTTTTPLPRIRRLLAELGQNIRLARLRRNLSAEMLAQRAGMTRKTLSAVESGDPGVVIGAYANALASLGLEEDLKLLGFADELGRKLQDANLPTKSRARRKK